MIKRKYFVNSAAILMALGLSVASLSGCGGGGNNNNSANQQETQKAAKNDDADTADDSEDVDTEEGDSENMDSGSELTEDNSRDDSVLRAAFTDAYAGMGDDGNYYFMSFTEDGTGAIFVVLSGDGTQSMNLVGPCESSDDGTLTITDAQSGTSTTFGIGPGEEDGTYVLTFTDGSSVFCGQANASDVIDIIEAIDNGTEIVNPLA